MRTPAGLPTTLADGTRADARGLDLGSVEAALRDLVAERRAQAGAHHHTFAELWQALAVSVDRGKKLRPALFVDAYRHLAGEERAHRDRAAAIDLACALELLHTAFVTHDDVIDNDIVRRGEPNVSGRAIERARALGATHAAAQRFGAASGIIAGDMLLSTALTLVGALNVDGPTRRSLLRLFESTVAETAAGEHADVWFSLGVESADSDRVLRTVELKTARYSCQAPLEAAAILAGSDARQLAALREIGRGLGVVYQLRDDVLGVFGSSASTGKSALSDLREGVQTLLIVHARSAPEWAGVGHLFGDPDLDESGADALRVAIRPSGALERVERAIELECDVVREQIDAGSLPPELGRALRGMLERCVGRDV